MATETLQPDGIVIGSGYSGAYTDIDDDPDSIDANLLTISLNTSGTVRVQFPTPTGAPTTGAGVQSFRIALSKTTTNNGRSDDTYTIDLYENGVQRQASIASGSGVAVDPSTTVFDATWDASNLNTADGSLVECYISTTPEAGGGPVSRGSIQVEAVEWNVDYSTGVTEEVARSTSWAWAGQSFGANESIEVAASTSWAWSGQAFKASFSASISSSTSWAWTGQGFNVNAAFIESIVSSTTWAWAGQVLDDVQDINEIISASASWAWAGQAVTESVGVEETVSVSTSWAWTGQAMFVSPNVLLGVGSFNFTGQNFKANQVEILEVGTSWSWSGQALKADMSIPIANALFNWAPQNLNINAAVNIVETPSTSWAWTGLGLTESTGIIEEITLSNSWAWTGQNVTDKFDFINTQSPASFNFAGKPVTDEVGGGVERDKNFGYDILETLRIPMATNLTDIDRDYEP